MASPRALVTGATGFIGSHLVDALLERGWQVRCLVRSPERARTLSALPVEVVPGDLDNGSGLTAGLQDVEYVFHVAGLTKALREPDYQRVNVLATRRLLEACEQHARSLQRLLLVSSLSAAGPASDGIPLTEDSPCRPISPYGRSKLGAERVVEEWMERLPSTIVRPPAVYGPRDPDTFFLFRVVAMGLRPVFAHSKRMSLVHVSDLVEGMILAATSPRAVGRTYFMSADNVELDQILMLIARSLARRPVRVRVPLALLDVAALVAEGTARAVGAPTVLTRNKVQEFRQQAWVCSAERARQELGFVPRISLAEGVAQTAKWYQAAGWL